MPKWKPIHARWLETVLSGCFFDFYTDREYDETENLSAGAAQGKKGAIRLLRQGKPGSMALRGKKYLQESGCTPGLREGGSRLGADAKDGRAEEEEGESSQVSTAGGRSCAGYLPGRREGGA